jgi:metal-responsive CopG/Arc/MetJ family transcriptional regulator
MPKRKVAVALSDWLLDELDSAAEQRKSSRSALVEEAVADYVVRTRAHQREQSYRGAALAALQDMGNFAAEVERDPSAALGMSSLEKLRALRAQGRGIAE